MNNKFLVFILSALFIAPVFGQEKLSKEETAIKKVIEDETAFFMARDYDNWANCYVHSPITYMSWISPSANKGSLNMVQGWADISKQMKDYLVTHPKQENLPKKTEYQFKVSDDMAFVTFKEDDNPMQSRVLEKENGQWKILRMEASASANLKKFRQLYDLQRMAGHWELDMSTRKISEEGSWKLLHSEVDFKDVPTGIQGTVHSMFRAPNGELRTAEGLVIFTLNMTTSTVGAFNSVHYPQSNWSRAYQAQGTIDDDGKLNMTGKEVGSTAETDVKFSYQLEGDRIAYQIKVMDGNKEVFTESYQMKHKRFEEEVKP